MAVRGCRSAVSSVQRPYVAVRECLSTGFTVQPPSVGRLLGQRVGHSDSGDRTCFDLIKSTCFAFFDHIGRRDCYSIQDTSLNINMNHAYNFEDYLSDSTIAFIFVDILHLADSSACLTNHTSCLPVTVNMCHGHSILLLLLINHLRSV